VPLQRQQGASLIEVLVALTLVAFTMLGLLGLQLRSMSAQKDSLDRRTAAVLAAEFSERVTANYLGAEALRYDGRVFNPLDAPPTPAACVTPSNCTDLEIANRDWAQFTREVRARLPGGVAFAETLSGAGTPLQITITVGWLDTQRIDQLNVGGAAVVRDAACPATAEMDADLRYRCYVASVHP
jgi:type IV pilus modification protein PilV